MKQHILFIINPIAGTIIRQFKEEYIHSSFKNNSDYTYEIKYTDYAGHGLEIVKQVVKKKTADIIAIAGGDGSINEIAAPLFHSGIKLAILPAGSGNGLAHHLNIPMDLKQSVALIKKGNTQPVDVGIVTNEQLGQHYFLSNFGMGYDAEVIHAYDEVKQRGFLTYFVFLVQSLFSLKPKQITIEFNNTKETLRPFVFTIANSSQYGYRIEVAPEASTSDGILDSLLVRDATLFRVLRFAVFSILKIKNEVKAVADFHKSEQFLIHFSEETKVQIDGEPFFAKGHTRVSVDKHALEVFVN